MSDELFPDVEGALRSWLRADAGVAGKVGTRVFLEMPAGVKDADWPLITLARIGGTDSPGSQVPLDNALISIECWGVLDAEGRKHWRDLGALVNTVRSALWRIDGRTAIATGVRAFGVQVAGVVRSPDPANGRPRYVITVEVISIASAP